MNVRHRSSARRRRRATLAGEAEPVGRRRDGRRDGGRGGSPPISEPTGRRRRGGGMSDLEQQMREKQERAAREGRRRRMRRSSRPRRARRTSTWRRRPTASSTAAAAASPPSCRRPPSGFPGWAPPARRLPGMSAAQRRRRADDDEQAHGRRAPLERRGGSCSRSRRSRARLLPPPRGAWGRRRRQRRRRRRRRGRPERRRVRHFERGLSRLAALERQADSDRERQVSRDRRDHSMTCPRPPPQWQQSFLQQEAGAPGRGRRIEEEIEAMRRELGGDEKILSQVEEQLARLRAVTAQAQFAPPALAALGAALPPPGQPQNALPDQLRPLNSRSELMEPAAAAALMDAGANAEALKSAGSYLNGEMGAPAFVAAGRRAARPRRRRAGAKLENRPPTSSIGCSTTSREGPSRTRAPTRQSHAQRVNARASVCSMIAPSHFKSPHSIARPSAPRSFARSVSRSAPALPVYVSSCRACLSIRAPAAWCCRPRRAAAAAAPRAATAAAAPLPRPASLFWSERGTHPRGRGGGRLQRISAENLRNLRAAGTAPGGVSPQRWLTSERAAWRGRRNCAPLRGRAGRTRSSSRRRRSCCEERGVNAVRASLVGALFLLGALPAPHHPRWRSRRRPAAPAQSLVARAGASVLSPAAAGPAAGGAAGGDQGRDDARVAFDIAIGGQVCFDGLLSSDKISFVPLSTRRATTKSPPPPRSRTA